MRQLFKSVFIFLMAAIALTACSNTVKGVGEDMEQNGKSIQQSVKKQ